MRPVWQDPRLLVLGVVILALAAAEGTANDWLPLVMVDGHHLDPALGSGVYVVFALATSVTVLHLGRVLLTGSPDEVRASDAVQEAYLGRGREALFLDGSGPARLEVG